MLVGGEGAVEVELDLPKGGVRGRPALLTQLKHKNRHVRTTDSEVQQVTQVWIRCRSPCLPVGTVVGNVL